MIAFGNTESRRQAFLFVCEPLVEFLGFGVEIVDLPIERSQPIALLGEGIDPCGIVNQEGIDSQSFGFFAELPALAFENIGFASVFFELAIESIKPREGIVGKLHRVVELLQLRSQLRPTAPIVFQADSNFDRAGAVLMFGNLGFLGQDFGIEFFDANRQLGPTAILLRKLGNLASQNLSAR